MGRRALCAGTRSGNPKMPTQSSGSDRNVCHLALIEAHLPADPALLPSGTCERLPGCFHRAGLTVGLPNVVFSFLLVLPRRRASRACSLQVSELFNASGLSLCCLLAGTEGWERLLLAGGLAEPGCVSSLGSSSPRAARKEESGEGGRAGGLFSAPFAVLRF